MGRPGTLCFLKEGKSIGAQKGFANTFNWMVNFINNLSGTDGVEVDRSDADHPLIKGSGSGDGGGGGGGTTEPTEPTTPGTAEDAEITVIGDNGVSAKGKTIMFVSDPNSNVKFTVSGGGDAAIQVMVGVFYK